MTVVERAQLDCKDHFGLTDEQFDANREYIEGSLYYAKRRLFHSWADLKLAVRDSFRNGKGGR